MNRTRGAALVAFLVFLGLYIFTLYPTVSPYRDSGDMAAAALTLGVSHPPGYPLYITAGKIWVTLVRLGDTAYRLNVFSAVCGAAALAFLLLALAPEFGLLAAVGAVLFLGLSPAFWRLSLPSEMYALNALFAAAILFTLPRFPYLAAFLFGLGLGNHQTLLFLLPGILWYGRKQLPLGTAFFFLGLSIYLYLPLRAFQDPAISWGDPHTLRGFWRVLTRADYGGMRLRPEATASLDKAALFTAAKMSWLAFSTQAGALALAVCALGAWFKRREPMTWLCVAGFVLAGPFFIGISNLPPEAPESLPILEPHLVLPVLCLAPLFAAGIAAAAQPALVLGGLLALAPVARAALNPGPMHRGDYAAHDYERNLLSAVEPGGLIMDPDDPTAFTLSYFQNARGLRTDVIPMMYFRTRWGYEQLRRRHPDVVASETIQSGQELYYYLLNSNLAKSRPIYADLPHKVLPPFRSFPQGWGYRIFAQDLPRPDPELLYARSVSLWALSRSRPAASTDFFSTHALDYGASAMNNLGVRALGDGKLELAEAAFKKALAYQPRLDQAWNNWGNVLHRRSNFTRAAAAYRLALAVKPQPHYRYNLGRSLAAAGDEAGAEREWKAAIAQTDIPDAQNDLALLWLNRGDSGRAAATYEDLVARHPDYLPARFNLGLARARLGQKKEAIAAFERFRELSKDPQDRSDATLWLKQLQK